MAGSLTRSVRCFLLLIASALLVACGSQHAAPVETTASATNALTEQRRVSFVLPAGVQFNEVALGANGNLKLEDRVFVQTPANGYALSTNAGLAQTAVSNVGLDAKVGNVVSTAAVTLKDRALVTGSVTSGRSVGQGAGVVVTGSVTQNAVLTPVQELSWNVSFTVGTTDVTASSGQSRTVVPGTYRNVTAFANGTVTLNGAGTYYFDKLDLEPGGRLTLNGGTGNILVYVRSTLVFRGTMSGLPADRFALAYLGTAAVAVETSFSGTFVAPSADVRFGTGNGTHSGAVLARNVQVDPGVRFTFRPYSRWNDLTFNVVPTFACVDRRTLDTGVSAMLGYYNPNPVPIAVPVGTQNRFTTGAENRGQPASFLPGRSSLDFGVDFGAAQSLTWSLQGSSLAVARTAASCTRTGVFDSTVDTTITKVSPRDNFGAANSLSLGTDSHLLVGFHRAAIKQVVGSSRFVSKATLEFTLAQGTQANASAFMMKRSNWTESGATWNCAQDANAAPGQETCASGTPWLMQRGAGEEAADVTPWRTRIPERAVTGTWSGNTLRFDVTRDTANLLGGEGVKRGMSWIIVHDGGANIQLGSRESTLKPRLNLELTSFPDVASGGMGPLSFTVDTTVVPSPATAEALPDGVTRTFAGSVAPSGRMTRFVERELIVRVPTHADVVAFASRWGGQVLQELPPPTSAPEQGYQALVRIDTARANLDGFTARMRGIDHRLGGARRVSSQTGLATTAAAAQELLNGTSVALNFGVDLTMPTTDEWMNRDIHDGAWDPNSGDPPAPGDNAFGWPGFASCNPVLSDPSNPDSPKFCSGTFPNGAPLGQNYAVADAWRALAIAGKLTPRVFVGIADNGWGPDDDYPDYFINNALHPSSSVQRQTPYHGDVVVRSGFALPGNDFGAAGPGGPVASLDLLSMRVDDSWSTNTAFNALRGSGVTIISASFHSVTDTQWAVFKSDVLVNSAEMVFTSAGNDGVDVDAEVCPFAGTGCVETEENQPCESDGVLCVGGLDYNQETIAKNRQTGATLSNWGSDGDVDYAGPWWPFVRTGANGAGLPTTATTFNALSVGGTSFATPYMAGIGALVAAAPDTFDMTRAKVCLALASARIPFGPASGIPSATRVPDALAAVRCAMTGSTAGNLQPTIEITLPPNGATVPRGQYVSVMANARDYESGYLSVGWSSDVDGPLSTSSSGQRGAVVFRTLGNHVLTAKATANLTYDTLPPTTVQQVVTTSINVTVVEAPPVVNIITPAADGASFLAGGIRFIATGNALGAQIGAAFRWRSVNDADGSVDFEDVAGSSILPFVTTLGNHTTTVTYTDVDSGLTATDVRTYTVTAGTGDEIQISSPLPEADGWARLEWDNPVLVLATPNFSPANVHWEIQLDGNIHPLAVSNNSLWIPQQDVYFACPYHPAVLYASAISPGSQGHYAAPVALPIRVFGGQGCIQ